MNDFLLQYTDTDGSYKFKGPMSLPQAEAEQRALYDLGVRDFTLTREAEDPRTFYSPGLGFYKWDFFE